MSFDLRSHLLAGQAIPALPLALTNKRKWDQVSQRALVRYYVDAGAGGLAVGVHSTQFEIREPDVGLFEPVLEFAADAAKEWLAQKPRSFVLIAGICGRTPQAIQEARTAQKFGYSAGLLSLGAWKADSEVAILKHCQTVAREIPIVGFYLQPAVGGRSFSFGFWRKFAEIPELAAIKMAPFNRYKTIDVVRAVIEAERDDVALYTGNDDNIIADLLTPYRFGKQVRYIDGGLLGQWGVWTSSAVKLLRELQAVRKKPLAVAWGTKNIELTDANAAIFDAANDFSGCIPGIHEILRRQGLLKSIACLNPHETLSRAQDKELSRVAAAYPWLTDDAFVAKNLRRWRSE